MRIGFVSTYPPIECGIATYTNYLNEVLIKGGHETFVVSQIGAQGKNVFPAFSVRDTSMPTLVYNASANQTPDVMHIQHEFGLYGDVMGVQVVELILRYRVAGIPVVTTLHTVESNLGLTGNTIMRLIISESSAVIVHEQIQKDTLVKMFGMAKKIHVIPHGVREVPRVRNAKKLLDLQGSRVILLCGYFRPSKCFHRMIKLMPDICRKLDDAVLCMAGKTRMVEYMEYRERLFKMINESPVNDRIVVLRGQFPQHTFDTIISACDVMVLPYELGGQSGIMAQCYAFNKPAVVSDLPAFQRSIEASHGGIVCKTDEDYVKAIVKTLKNDSFRRKLEANIKKYVARKVGWSTVAQSHEKVYQSVVAVPYTRARYVHFEEE